MWHLCCERIFSLHTGILVCIMSAHTQTMQCEQEHCCDCLRMQCHRTLPFLSSLLGSLCLCLLRHKVESDSKCAFSIIIIHTSKFAHCYLPVYIERHSQNLEIHARVIKCLLALSLSHSLASFFCCCWYTNVMNCVHLIIRNQFNSIQFNSNLSLNSSFCFPWQWTETIATAASSSIFFSFCLLS